MTYVLGIDPSLTGTGVARVTKDGDVQVAHFGRSGKRGETLVQRAERINSLVEAVEEWVFDEPLDRESDHWTDWGHPELVVIEGASHGSAGGSAWDRAHLWWRLVANVEVRRTAVCAPRTRARWATGSGKSDKGAVGAAVRKIWPDVELDCGDCIDALALATIAAQHLDWDVPTLQRHRDALAAVKWPEAA